MNAKSEVAYKYFSSRYVLEVLRTLELKITPPNQFNDPFEFYPHVICSSPEREAEPRLFLLVLSCFSSDVECFEKTIAWRVV